MHCNKLPVRSFKCVVELTLNEVSAPGARLAQKEDLYLNVCLLGQQRRTRLVQPVFPLKFADHLIFEKTFKFCRNPTDVVNFLDDLHVLVELIQLGHSKDNEVLAWYETNARDFLFPTFEFKTDFHGPQRDVLMKRNEEFPGSIAPRLHFCTSIRIDETQTPSLDILREYENRFVHDPVIEMNQHEILKKKKRAKSASLSPIKPGILRNANKQESFANHTICSAIKSDFLKPEVKFKLNQLNSSVRKTKSIKQIPKLNFDYDQFNPNFRPFVVRKVEDTLILRKPELHDVLGDGLVLTKKNPKGQGSVIVPPRNPGSPGSISSRSRSRSANRRSHSIGSSYQSDTDGDYHSGTNDSGVFHTISSKKKERNPILSRALNDQRKRESRSTDPKSGHTHKLGKSLNRNLSSQNRRPSSASSNRSPKRFQDMNFDLLPEAGDFRKFDSTLDNCNSCQNAHSCCDVCQDFNYRTHRDARGIRPRRNESSLNKNNGSVFNKVMKERNNDPLNETQLLDSDFHANFAENYSSTSFRKANDQSNLTAKKRNNYPRNKSFSYYAPPCQNAEWKYNRYYPWLFNYTEYLRELEDELHWLKVKSNCLDH